MVEGEEEKPKPIVSEKEIEEIIQELERKEEEKRKLFEQKQKELSRILKPVPASPQQPPPPPPTSQPIQSVQAEELPEPVKPVLPEPAPIEPPPPPPQSLLKTFLKYFLLFMMLFGLFYLGLTYKTYSVRAKYLYKVSVKGQSLPTAPVLPVIPETNQINLPDSLLIPKIELDVPIIWTVEEKNLLNELKKGVIQYAGTALPDEEGNVVIFGHSSSYPWQNEKYGQAFALLGKLIEGDNITIIYQKNKYLYRVTGKTIVSPEKIEILSSQKENLTLITCWPVGTTLKRLVVSAQRIEKPAKQTEDTLLPTAL